MTQPSIAKVIIADDEQIIATTLEMILNQSGFEAIAVSSGEEAIALAKTFEPHLLISDVMMCGITGIEAAIRVKRMLPACKVLLLSGHASSAELLEEAHAEGYSFELLIKPLHPSRLLAKVREQLVESITSS